MTTADTPAPHRVDLADNTVSAQEIAAVTDVLSSGWLSAGPVTRDFERRFAAALDAPDAVAVSSGTAALHLALSALGIGPGDEVIVPSLTFVASAAMVTLQGGVPVFADVLSPGEPTLAPDDVARLMTERTKAVVVMHYGGYPARTREITDLARAHGVPVVEDAAHAPVVRTPDGALGTIGDIGCFSFFASKNMTTGEGGMVVARDPDVLERVRSARAHCLTRSTWDRMRTGTSDYDVPGLGLNYRPTEMASAIGRVQLARLPDDRRIRRELARRYHEMLQGVPGLTVPFATHQADTAHHLMAVVLPPGVPRPKVQELLKAAGIQTSVHYPPTHLLSYYRDVVAGRRDPATPEQRLPVTEALAGTLLSLPLHARMTADDVAYVAGRLTEAVKR
ncbi:MULTISPECIES: DegT/DnrJ/EryC1/StrS family aminotransferase [Streptomyces]|uniref:Aminotransferase DegT n=1 Tax=Streptomyces canarius TaxID=285453 RepID=A0ABQ3D0M0_9ACTN|nr:DegT/DnrJ/EryC1/StrS family aminotransferase [Streptomyces canarius]GHA52185.1 aminotransferase DegT [Streptomyces canarius]